MSNAVGKDPAKVRAGHAAAARRWGPKRVIRLDGLPSEQRAFIAELVEVARRNAVRTADAA